MPGVRGRPRAAALGDPGRMKCLFDQNLSHRLVGRLNVAQASTRRPYVTHRLAQASASAIVRERSDLRVRLARGVEVVLALAALVVIGQAEEGGAHADQG